MSQLREKLSELHRDEDGQSIVFGVISIFLVLMFGALVLGVGRVTARRIQMQFAADAAAYSAAVTEAECLNAIAVINNTMARTRARSLRYVADVNAYGVLAEMRDRILGMNEVQDQHLQQTIGELQAELNETDDPAEQQQLTERINRLTERRRSLRSGQEMENDLLEVTDPAYWTQQMSVLERQIDTLEVQLEGAAGEEREELEREIEGLRAELEEAQERLDGLDPVDGEDPEWIQEIVGIDQAHLAYGGAPEEGHPVEGAYFRAEKWVPAAEEWLREMSRLEHTIAVLAPYLSSETAYRVARKNGAEYVSHFPASRWLPRDDALLDVFVYHNETPQQWRVEGGGTYIDVAEADCGECSECLSCGDCEQCWHVAWGRGASTESRYIVCELEDRTWFIRDITRDESRCIHQREEVYITTYGPEGVDVIRHGADEGYSPPILELVNRNGTWPDNTIFVRRTEVSGDPQPRWDPDEGAWITPDQPQGGVVEMARYQWDEESQQWVMPEDEDFQPLGPTQVNVDGVNLSVTMDPVLPLPGRARVRRLIPPSIDLLAPDGTRWGYVDLRDQTRIHATINGVQVEVRDGAARLARRGQWLSTRTTRGRWHTHFDQNEQYWWQHRLVSTDPGAWEQAWHYTYEEFGARLQPEANMARLMAVAGSDRDMARSMGYSESAISSGRLTDEVAESSDLPHWAYDDDPEWGNLAGWLRVSTGTRISVGSQGQQGDQSYAYHQTRPCWYTTCDGGFLPDDSLCPVCGGRGEVTIDSGAVDGRLGRLHRDLDPPAERERDFLDAQFGSDSLPLVLKEDFFMYGMSVGVWHRRESHFPAGRAAETPERPVEYLLHDPYPGMKGVVRGPGGQSARDRGEILRPQWGYFAVSGARPHLDGAGGSDAGNLVHGAYFREVSEREEWVDRNVNNLYLRQADGEWTYWNARLFPLSEQVLDADVIQGETEAAESGTGWLMRRLAYGSPGGLIRSRQGNLPPGYRHYGDVTGWTSNIYGDFDRTYPPEAVRRDLLHQVRPRQRYPALGRPYDDAQGVRRDPLMEYLGTRPQGQRRTGGQLDYNALERDDVLH